MVVIFALLMVAVGYFVLSRTPFGRAIYALGGNEEAARISGMNIPASIFREPGFWSM